MKCSIINGSTISFDHLANLLSIILDRVSRSCKYSSAFCKVCRGLCQQIQTLINSMLWWSWTYHMNTSFIILKENMDDITSCTSNKWMSWFFVLFLTNHKSKTFFIKCMISQKHNVNWQTYTTHVNRSFYSKKIPYFHRLNDQNHVKYFLRYLKKSIKDRPFLW